MTTRRLICHYATIITDPPCYGPVLYTIHDARGCCHACHAHAVWRMKKNFMEGHSADCLIGRS